MSTNTCCICGSKTLPQHILRPKWLDILKTHCNSEIRGQLPFDLNKTQFVCANHFEAECPRRLTAEKGLKYLRTEFYGPKLAGACDRLNNKARKRTPSSFDAELEPTKKTWENPSLPPDAVHQMHPAPENAPMSPKGVLDERLKEFGGLVSLLDSIALKGSEIEKEEIREGLIHSTFGTQVVIGAVCSVLNNLAKRLNPHDSRRTPLKAALDTLETMELAVQDKEIAYLSEMSSKTVQRARLEREEVRVKYEKSPCIYIHDLTQIYQEKLGRHLLEDDAPIEEPNEQEDEEKERPRKYRRSSQNRDSLTTQLQVVLSDWCADNAPIQSGSLNHRQLNFTSLAEAYKAYKEEMGWKQLQFYSFSGFCATLFSWSVKPIKYDKYACPLCYNLYHKGRSFADIENDRHTKEKDAMWSLYRQQIDYLQHFDDDFIVLIMDYSRVHELGAISLAEDEKASKLSILNFTLVLPGNVEQRYDFLATGKQGTSFMRKSIDELARLISKQIENRFIEVWSDCGLKSYGTVNNMHHLHKLLNVNITHNFFPRYHGHSRCDAHFGRGKAILRQTYPQGGLNDTLQVVSAFNSIENTHVYQISFQNAVKDGIWRPQFGVRSIQKIRFLAGSIFVGTLTGRQDPNYDTKWEMVELPQLVVNPKQGKSAPINSTTASSTKTTSQSPPTTASTSIATNNANQFNLTLPRKEKHFVPTSAFEWESFNPNRFVN